jgi:putative acetyltransferase
MDCTIRPEAQTDQATVHEINKRAFETESEADLVDGLRNEADPLISLVAEVEDQVVGHILFSPVAIGDTAAGPAALGLAPLAVHPDFQDRGIGAALVQGGLEVCVASGVEIVVTLGHPDYYARFGFGPAVEEGISYISREVDPFFMVKELVPGKLENYQGEVKYHRLFEEL